MVNVKPFLGEEEELLFKKIRMKILI